MHSNQQMEITDFDDEGLSVTVKLTSYNEAAVEGSMTSWLVRGMVSGVPHHQRFLST